MDDRNNSEDGGSSANIHIENNSNEGGQIDNNEGDQEIGGGMGENTQGAKFITTVTNWHTLPNW
jgi:hypothetical protein